MLNVAGSGIVDCEREHPVQPLDTALTPFTKRTQDDLRVAAREEFVAQRLQFAAQVVVIVDAAVEHDRLAGVLIQHRLCRPVTEIDDLEAAVPEHHAAEIGQPVAVRPAPRLGVHHALHPAGRRRAAVEADLSCDAAHLLDSPPWPLS